MAAGTVSLNRANDTYDAGLDSVVIRRVGGRIQCGRSLDVTGITLTHIKAGHIIIRSTTDEHEFKPMPVADGAYEALPAGYEYAGVWVRTTPINDCRGAIQYDGEINDQVLPYSISDIKAAIKTALPSLYFMHD